MARVVVVAGIAKSLINFRGHLLIELVRRGHWVYACAPEDSPEITQQLARMGVTYASIPMARTGINPLADLAYMCRLRRVFRAIRPDVVLGYTIKPVIYGSLAARLAGVDRICSMITGLGYAFSAGGLKARLVERVAKVLYRLALRGNDVVFFQNPDDQQLFTDLGLVSNRQSCLINGSGIDLQQFVPAPFPDSPAFLLIARLLRDKGISEYAKAAESVRRRYPNARFRLVGMFDSSLNGISPMEVDAWCKAGTIEYLGELADVRPAIADSSVFVLPSFYREGTPRTILEAMAMGRPIITTDAPGCRETVEQGVNGYLVPPRDVDALTIAMESFIQDPDSVARMGEASRRIAVDKYDVRKVTASILDAMQLS